ncbi:MAG: ACT domain-containing protein, partial [Pseudomonadales bacterium]
MTSDNQIVLLNVSGQDQPGLMAMLTSVLSPYQVRILDLGQAVIHDELNLGMLLDIEVPDALEAVLGALRSACEDASVVLRTERISAADYEEWVASHGKPRLILTLLAAGVSGAQLAAVTRIVHEQGLNIDSIRRLSGRIPLDHPSVAARTSIEMSLRGEPGDAGKLKADLLAAADSLIFDFSVQRDTVYRRNRRLVAF